MQYDGETPAAWKRSAFIIFHWAKRQVYYKQLSEEEKCKELLVSHGPFLWSSREPLRPGNVWQCWNFCKNRVLRGQETWRGYGIKLWKWNLGCSGDAKMVMPELWDIFSRELYTWSGTRPRQADILECLVPGWWCCLGRLWKLLRNGAWLEGVCHWA